MKFPVDLAFVATFVASASALTVRLRKLAGDRRGSSELSVSTLLVLGGVACVGIVLPSLIDSARTMGDVFRSQVSVLAGQSSPGGNEAASGNSWSVAVGPNGVSASGPQGSFSAGPNGVSASSGSQPKSGQTSGSSQRNAPLYRGGPSIVK